MAFCLILLKNLCQFSSHVLYFRVYQWLLFGWVVWKIIIDIWGAVKVCVSDVIIYI